MFEGFLAPSHLMIIAVIALLLFGDRLPEVMRSVGKGVAEFKKGLRGIESAIQSASTSSPTLTNQSETVRRDEVAVPRFDPPTSEPRIENSQTVSAAADQTVPAPHPVTEHSAANDVQHG